MIFFFWNWANWKKFSFDIYFTVTTGSTPSKTMKVFLSPQYKRLLRRLEDIKSTCTKSDDDNTIKNKVKYICEAEVEKMEIENIEIVNFSFDDGGVYIKRISL